jgi:hypothetical protein
MSALSVKVSSAFAAAARAEAAGVRAARRGWPSFIMAGNRHAVLHVAIRPGDRCLRCSPNSSVVTYFVLPLFMRR